MKTIFKMAAATFSILAAAGVMAQASAPMTSTGPGAGSYADGKPGARNDSTMAKPASGASTHHMAKHKKMKKADGTSADAPGRAASN